MTAQAGIKAALRAAHAALSSNAFDEAIAAAREALELSENSSVDAYLLTGKALYKKGEPESLSECRKAYERAAELVIEQGSTSVAPWKGLAEVAAASGDDELLSESLSRVVDASSKKSDGTKVTTEKEALSLLESAVSLQGALSRLGGKRAGDAAESLGALARKVERDVPGLFASPDDESDDDDEKAKTVASFYEAVAASWIDSSDGGKTESKDLFSLDEALDALLSLRKNKNKKSLVALTSAAVADALAALVSGSARKEASASSPSHCSDLSRILSEAAESCLELAREVQSHRQQQKQQKQKQPPPARRALEQAFDLAVDAEASATASEEGEQEKKSATALWREAASALSSSSLAASSSAGDPTAAAAEEARAFVAWSDALEGKATTTTVGEKSGIEIKIPLDAASRALLRRGLRARWSRSLASSCSKSKTSSSSSSSLPLPPCSSLAAGAKLALLCHFAGDDNESNNSGSTTATTFVDDARRLSRAALKSAKFRSLPPSCESVLSARLSAARAAALSSPSSSSSSSPSSNEIDLGELSAIRQASPPHALSRPFSAAREASFRAAVASPSSSEALEQLRSLAETVKQEEKEHWLLAALARAEQQRQRDSTPSDVASSLFKEAAEEASRGTGASTDAEAASYWLEYGRSLCENRQSGKEDNRHRRSRVLPSSSPRALSPPPPPASAASAWLKAAAVPGASQPHAFAELGCFYRDARGDDPRALACFRRALDLDATVALAGEGAAELLLRRSPSSTKKEDGSENNNSNVCKAKSIAKRATERAPNARWAWRALADACVAEASFDAGLGGARGGGRRRATEAAADAAQALVGLLRCYSPPSSSSSRSLSDGDEQEEILRGWSDLGDAYLVAGRPGSALRAYERCAELAAAAAASASSSSLGDDGSKKLLLLFRARALASAATSALCSRTTSGLSGIVGGGDPAAAAESLALEAVGECSKILEPKRDDGCDDDDNLTAAASSTAAIARATAADAALRRGWGALSAGCSGEASEAARRAEVSASLAATAAPGARAPAKLLGDAALLLCLSRQEGDSDGAATQARRRYASALFRAPSVASAWGDVACALAASAGVARALPFPSSNSSSSTPQHFYSTASRVARAGLRLEGASARLWALLGSFPAEGHGNDPSSAVAAREAALCRSLSLDPRDGRTWASLARLYSEASDEEAAELCLAAARARVPADSSVWSAAGHASSWKAFLLSRGAREEEDEKEERRGSDESSLLDLAEDSFEHSLTLGGGAEPSLAVAEAEARRRRRPKRESWGHGALAAATRAASADPLCASAAVAAGAALLSVGDAEEAVAEFERALALFEEQEKEEREAEALPASRSRVSCLSSSSSLKPAAVAAVGLALASSAAARRSLPSSAASASLPQLDSLPAEERLHLARALLVGPSGRGKQEGGQEGPRQLRALLSDRRVGGDALAALAGHATAATAASSNANASTASAAALSVAKEAAACLPEDLEVDSLERARLAVVAAALLDSTTTSTAATTKAVGDAFAKADELLPLSRFRFFLCVSAPAAAAALSIAAEFASSAKENASSSRLSSRAAFADPAACGEHVARASLARASSVVSESPETAERLARLALKAAVLPDAARSADALLLLSSSSSASAASTSACSSSFFARRAAHLAPWRRDCRLAAAVASAVTSRG